jgi:RimJ/RimL family protein N-acetyltransferase
MAAAITPASTWPPATGQRRVARRRRSACATYTVGVFVPGLRGQGLGRKIPRLVPAWAFGVLGVHRVELEVLASNSRANGCHRACGFRQEGFRRQAGLYRDGWKDFILTAVPQPECASAAWDTQPVARIPLNRS